MKVRGRKNKKNNCPRLMIRMELELLRKKNVIKTMLNERER